MAYLYVILAPISSQGDTNFGDRILGATGPFFSVALVIVADKDIEDKLN